jgi:serine protease AprX
MATLRQCSARSLLVLVAALGLLAPGLRPAAADTPLTTWLVTFNAPPSSYQLDVLGGVSDAVHGFSQIPVASVVAPAGVASLLRALPGVKGVYPNETYHYLSDLATQSSGASNVWQDYGYNGAGIGIAVIDAGVDGTHPDLCAAAVFCKGTGLKTVQNVKILGRQEVAQDPVVVLPDQISTDSSSGHGSHVAGIAAGFGTAGTDPTRYRGVAYGANLIGFGVGEAVALSTNRRAGPPLAASAVVGVVMAYAVRTGLLFAASNWVLHDVQTDLAGLIALGLAAFIAAGRLR